VYEYLRESCAVVSFPTRRSSDLKRIGGSWRFRYKSLVLFTTKSYSALPGLEMKGDPNSYPTKNEMADYLEDYVAHFDLPYRMNTLATRIEKENDFFNIFTVNEKF